MNVTLHLAPAAPVFFTLKYECTPPKPICATTTLHLSSKGSPTVIPQEVIRSTTEEKEFQITMLNELKAGNIDKGQEMLAKIQQVAIHNGNIFEALMETVKYCSLGQITNALFEVGGQYRRNM
jgi:methylmalonyl-CoA mutase